MPRTNQEQFIPTNFSSSDLRIVRETTTTEPVTLEEAKNYLRINNTQDDTLIQSMITNARRQAEIYINSDIVPKERIVHYDTLNEDINLYYAPVASVDTVTIDGVAATLDDEYELVGLDNPLFRLANQYGEKVQITYTTAGRPAADIKIGVLCYLASLYYQREAKMPTNWKQWLSPFKVYGYYGVR